MRYIAVYKKKAKNFLKWKKYSKKKHLAGLNAGI
jgi:hypothetical protein